jgi:hypothetical protein
MDNPEIERIQVNIKGVEKPAWEIARKQSSRHNESFGSVVSRALYQMDKQDSGPRELPPINALTVPEPLRAIPEGNLSEPRGNPVVKTTHETIAFLASIAAETGDKIADVPGMRALITDLVREARGLPPLPKRLVGPRRGKVAAVAHENGEARE